MNRKDLQIIKHIGKGKSGNSYLCEFGSSQVVLKEMHDEKVDYYHFAKSKIEHELDSYRRLEPLGIKMPQLLSSSLKESYLIKEYIGGKTATELITENSIDQGHISKMLEIENLCRASGINIDYFPSNFVIAGSDVYYVDYEFNEYSEEWNFSNWGIFYWLNAAGMKLFSLTGDSSHINEPGTGKPKKTNDLETRRLSALLAGPRGEGTRRLVPGG